MDNNLLLYGNVLSCIMPFFKVTRTATQVQKYDVTQKWLAKNDLYYFHIFFPRRISRGVFTLCGSLLACQCDALQPP